MSPEQLSFASDRWIHPRHGRPVETVQLAARLTDPDTSRAAAASLTPGRTEAFIVGVFRGHIDNGPGLGEKRALTDDELCAALPRMHPPTVKSARSRLSKAGLLRDSGRTRPSNRGRQSVVWVLA